MIKRMNESQLQINLIDYLASLKKYKSTKKREIVFKKRLKQENISSINKNVTIKIQSDDLKKQYENIEKESYGLTKTKRKVSAEAKKKKIHNLNGKTETLRIKITPLSPKLHNSSHYKSLKHNIEEAGKKLIASKRLVKSQDV